MELRELLMMALSVTAVRVPMLIALVVGLVWVLRAPRGAVRNGALWGIGLMTLSIGCSVVLNLIPLWFISQNDFEAMQGISVYTSIGHFAAAMLEALAVVLLLWAMTRALRGQTPPPVP